MRELNTAANLLLLAMAPRVRSFVSVARGDQRLDTRTRAQGALAQSPLALGGAIGARPNGRPAARGAPE